MPPTSAAVSAASDAVKLGAEINSQLLEVVNAIGQEPSPELAWLKERANQAIADMRGIVERLAGETQAVAQGSIPESAPPAPPPPLAPTQGQVDTNDVEAQVAAIKQKLEESL